VNVKGLIEIDGEDIVIERELKRKLKKDGNWNVKNTLNYYRINAEGEQELLTEEHATQTTQKIKETIGSDKDFELMVLATSQNMDDLVDMGVTESTKMLNRFIGLEILEEKEKLVRDMYNKFSKSMKSNIYSIGTLEEENLSLEENIKSYNLSLEENTNELDKTKTLVTQTNDKIYKLIESKKPIDNNIKYLNPDKLNESIENLTIKGKRLKQELEELNKNISKYKDVIYDEVKYEKINSEISSNNVKVAKLETTIDSNNRDIDRLSKVDTCQICGKDLTPEDNAVKVSELKNKNKQLQAEIIKIENLNFDLKSELDKLKELKRTFDDKNRLELQRDKLSVDIDSLRNKYKTEVENLKKYNDNKEFLNFNIEIDSKVEYQKTELRVYEHKRDKLSQEIEQLKNNIKNSETKISNNNELIEDKRKEEYREKIYKIYISMVGKNGISKIILRTVLPIINSELERIMEDSCDFIMELSINEKNELIKNIVLDGVEKSVKSGSGFEKTVCSLALRSVLGKLSSLPKPNFITFDEVLGKVAEENMEKIKFIMDKIKDMYDVVFFITHSNIVKDWADNVITVVKEENISKVTIN
jgi:DNA repair exonuclease SbcCD ATPase subunit